MYSVEAAIFFSAGFTLLFKSFDVIESRPRFELQNWLWSKPYENGLSLELLQEEEEVEDAYAFIFTFTTRTSYIIKFRKCVCRVSIIHVQVHYSEPELNFQSIMLQLESYFRFIVILL